MRHFLLLVLMVIGPLMAAEPAIPVVTGNSVVNDLTARIGGERFAVTCLVPPGADPHHYQPVPADAKRLVAAKLVVINGLGFEGWFEELAKESGSLGSVVVATSGIVPLQLADEDHPGILSSDPHAFHSVMLGVRYAENIRDALIAADPSAAEEIRKRAAVIITELRQLDGWAKKEIARIPPERRILVTDHDALQYFARDYGFQIRAPNTAMDDSEPSARRVAELVEFVRAQGVKGVFLEFGKQDKVVEQIAREAGVKIGDPLLLDGIGTAVSYAEMFRANVAAIVKALE